MVVKVLVTGYGNSVGLSTGFHDTGHSNKSVAHVQMSPDVSLPQFDVLGHRQRIVEASLSSGNYSR